MVTMFQNIRYCAFQQHTDSANNLLIFLLSIIIPLITGGGGGWVKIQKLRKWFDVCQSQGRNMTFWPCWAKRFLRGPLQWLMAVESVTVGWILNFRVCILLKGAVKYSIKIFSMLNFNVIVHLCFLIHLSTGTIECICENTVCQVTKGKCTTRFGCFSLLEQDSKGPGKEKVTKGCLKTEAHKEIICKTGTDRTVICCNTNFCNMNVTAANMLEPTEKNCK